MRSLQQYLPFTVLKHQKLLAQTYKQFFQLQQYLPFTVLKLFKPFIVMTLLKWLQQYLPFTVLKRKKLLLQHLIFFSVATVLTVYGIETTSSSKSIPNSWRCNSTYRLRY